jgi:hypothetical protein
VLDQLVRDWRDTLWPGHHLPASNIDELVVWLRYRFQDACDWHPAVVEFAEKIRHLRSAAGETEPQPERCDGVPCKRCDLMMLLFRQSDSDVHCLDPPY